MIISMTDIIEFLGDSIRPLKEGSNLYNCGHVLNVGMSNIKENRVDLYSQVIQSSKPKDVPHQIKISVITNDVKQWSTKCSCKAGLGRKCKHIFATLMFVLNFDSKLDTLSCTDVEQVWGTTAREKIVEKFDAKLMSELCCVKKIHPRETLSAEIKESNFRRLLAAAPESSAALHFYKKRKLTEITSRDVSDAQSHFNLKNCDEILESALTKSGPHRHLKYLILPPMQAELKDFYLKYISVDIAATKEINKKTMGQKNNLWKIERAKRICASNAYKLLTYSKNKNPNWKKKVEDYINPLNFQTPAMKYGSVTESEAYSLYEETLNYTVERLGFVVSPVLPWLGCSVDGYVPSCNKIIEIKCPVLGATSKIAEVIPTLKYLDENQCLKTNHMYYCQVQLGMAILNATSCDFIVYCKHAKEMNVVNIPFDPKIVHDYVKILSTVYITHVLPVVAAKKNK